MRARIACVALGFLSVGCDGEDATLGRTEPLTVDGAQFVAGALPGSPATVPATAEVLGSADPASTAARITGIDTAGLTVVPGQGKRFSGRVSKGAVTIGTRLLDQGAGYFRFSVGARDLASSEGEDTWSASANFQVDVTPGLRSLAFVAFDEDGRPGAQTILELCFLRPFPDNLNVCAPKTRPPYLVLSLAWDAGVDLDLLVVTPSGGLVGAKAPTTSTPTTDTPGTGTPGTDASVSAPAPEAGMLDRDSNAACALDYVNRENIVWQEKPSPGTYRIHASLFDPCGRTSARFRVTLNSRRALEDATYSVDESEIAVGEVGALDARSGIGMGLFVTEFEVR